MLFRSSHATRTPSFFAVEDGPVQIKKSAKKFEVDLESVKTARHAELREIYTKSKKGSLSPEQQAKLVLAEAVFLSRYEDPEISKDAQKRSSTLKGNDGLVTVAKNALLATTGEYEVARDALDPLSGPSEVGYYAQLFSGITDVKELEALGDESDIELDKPDAKKTAPATAPEPGEGADAGTPPAAEPESSDIQKRYDHAVAAFEGAAKIDATMPMYWLGRLHEAAGKEKKALAAYKKSLASSDAYIPALVGSGRLSYTIGDLNEAITAFEKINNELSALASNDERGEIGRAHV